MRSGLGILDTALRKKKCVISLIYIVDTLTLFAMSPQQLLISKDTGLCSIAALQECIFLSQNFVLQIKNIFLKDRFLSFKIFFI